MSTEIKLEPEIKLEQDVKELKVQGLVITDEKDVKKGNEDVKSHNNSALAKPEDKEKYITNVKRFLHYASECPLYKPGDRFHLKSFTKESVGSLSKLVQLESPEKIVNLITKVKQDGTSLYPEALVFALAFCATVPKNAKLQAEAYQVLRTVCSDPKDFFLFIKFLRELNLPNKIGGQGWKKAVKKWYLVWTPFDLSQILIRHRSHYGWTHRDIIRLAHVKPTTPQHQMLLTYALKGYKLTIKEYENSDDHFIKETLKFLKEWKEFLAEKDISVAAKKLEVQLYPFELIPNQMLNYQEIWDAILPRLEIKELIRVMHRVASSGFLRNSFTVQIFTDSLNNYYSKQHCSIHPSEVYITLRTYEVGPRMCLEMAVKQNRTHMDKLPPKTNGLVVTALTNLYNDLLKMLKPTNKSYLITLDCRAKLSQTRCWHCRYLTAAEASHFVTKSISCAESEENLTVVGFNEKGNICPVPIKKEHKLSDYATVIKEVPELRPTPSTVNWRTGKMTEGGRPDVSKVLSYATKRKLDIDVFLVLTDNSVLTGGVQPALENYRTEMNKKDAKVITCSLTGKLKNHKDVEGDGMLCLLGFDNKICRIIEAFARGAF